MNKDQRLDHYNPSPNAAARSVWPLDTSTNEYVIMDLLEGNVCLIPDSEMHWEVINVGMCEDGISPSPSLHPNCST